MLFQLTAVPAEICFPSSFVSLYNWHCPRSMRSIEQGLWNGLASVRPSVCLSHRLTSAAACGAFAAERPAGRRNRSIAGDGAQPLTRASSIMLTVDGRLWTQTCFAQFRQAVMTLVYSARHIGASWLVVRTERIARQTRNWSSQRNGSQVFGDGKRTVW